MVQLQSLKDLNSKKIIGRGEKFENLYVLDTLNLKTAATLNASLNVEKLDADSSKSIFATFVNNVSSHIWHNRLGHLSSKRLDILKDQIQCDISRFGKSVTPCYIWSFG
ncbi:uncharacterized protein LOC130783851 [Actinidia eriantha]|uniref:uncharacterized protein LOC130783851 n=1 Tax=Actinidia eriantha TaxID=165200 RepID=UPI002588D30C|nr:uncharacterized protein LOC130783851 [Actinidia eriantha]